MKSDNPHSGIYEADTARTLDLNGGNPACNQGGIVLLRAYPIENHPADSRVDIEEDGKSQALTSRMGTGGGNVPMVWCCYAVGNGQADQTKLHLFIGALNCMHDQQAVLCIRERCGCDGGGKGLLIQNDKTNTIATSNDQFICYSVDPYNGAQTGSKSSTLGVNAGMSTGRNGVLCVLNDQGGGVIMAENGEKSPCLRSQMKHHEPIVFALDRAAYNQGEHAQYNIGVDDTGGGVHCDS